MKMSPKKETKISLSISSANVSQDLGKSETEERVIAEDFARLKQEAIKSDTESSLSEKIHRTMPKRAQDDLEPTENLEHMRQSQKIQNHQPNSLSNQDRLMRQTEELMKQNELLRKQQEEMLIMFKLMQQQMNFQNPTIPFQPNMDQSSTKVPQKPVLKENDPPNKEEDFQDIQIE